MPRESLEKSGEKPESEGKIEENVAEEKETVNTIDKETSKGGEKQDDSESTPSVKVKSVDAEKTSLSRSKETPSTSDDSITAKPKAKNKKLSLKIPKRSKSGKSKKKSEAVESDDTSVSSDQPKVRASEDTPTKLHFFNLQRKSKSAASESGKKDKVAAEQTKAGKQKKASRNSLLTDFFPVRRSDRQSKADLEQMERKKLEEKILTGCEDGLKVVDIEEKGRGVISTKTFKRGEFVVEYAGDLITLTEAQAKEDHYSQNPDIGCYMYYFKYDNKNYCVDATSESGKLGRLLNHSKNGNCKTKVVGIGDRPYLILVAAKDISVNEELLYDYGDRSKEALAAHPWLAS